MLEFAHNLEYECCEELPPKSIQVHSKHSTITLYKITPSLIVTKPLRTCVHIVVQNSFHNVTITHYNVNTQIM